MLCRQDLLPSVFLRDIGRQLHREQLPEPVAGVAAAERFRRIRGPALGMLQVGREVLPVGVGPPPYLPKRGLPLGVGGAVGLLLLVVMKDNEAGQALGEEAGVQAARAVGAKTVAVAVAVVVVVAAVVVVVVVMVVVVVVDDDDGDYVAAVAAPVKEDALPSMGRFVEEERERNSCPEQQVLLVRESCPVGMSLRYIH